MKKIFSCFCIFLFFIFSGCASGKLEEKNLTIIKADGTEICVKAEIADRFETRQRGYMERENIPEGTGMLFVFEEDQILSFWMKNTPSPLSIAFITSSGKIYDIFDMKPFSLASTRSTGYVRYALEVPQGWFSKNNIKTGDKLRIDF